MDMIESNLLESNFRSGATLSRECATVLRPRFYQEKKCLISIIILFILYYYYIIYLKYQIVFL